MAEEENKLQEETHTVADKGKNRKARREKKPVEERVPKAEVTALNDRFLRLQADFDNFRKRTLREKGEIFQRANEELLLEILPVLDHLDLALAHVDDDCDKAALVGGVKLVSGQLLTVLGKFGLAPVEATGQEFDPNLHEAVSQLPSEDVEENRVIAQTRRGYVLGERLLRAAQVVVSSGPGNEKTEPVEKSVI